MTMPRAFINRRREQFSLWWRAPAISRDRILGSVVGALGFFWIGVLGRLALGPLPVSLEALGWWSLGSVAIGAVLGRLFPKAMTCICFPFSTFGGGK